MENQMRLQKIRNINMLHKRKINVLELGQSVKMRFVI